MRVAFKTSELAELVREHLKGRTQTSLSGGNPAIDRAIYSVLHEETEWTLLSRADLICSAMGRPDYLQVLTERS